MEYKEYTVTNARRSRKFGFGWSTEPSGDDPYSINPPTQPDYSGTIGQILRERESDRAYRTYGEPNASNYKSTRWFYGGKPIVAIYKWGCIKMADDLPYEEGMTKNFEHHYQNDVYGTKWFEFREDDLFGYGEIVSNNIIIRVQENNETDGK